MGAVCGAWWYPLCNYLKNKCVLVNDMLQAHDTRFQTT
ncbi:hypothetical protein HMPREF1051_0539 [Neisseria sicca VK64]|uniref:Uncharacterized protein n=1 Tax=Neisseria sicca VK64 TaxID=1095748 RepID=I2NGU1_NEISI|nr:hypothetical protein HMPREF1051_0539 [Neisseria sicca VK64]